MNTRRKIILIIAIAASIAMVAPVFAGAGITSQVKTIQQGGVTKKIAEITQTQPDIKIQLTKDQLQRRMQLRQKQIDALPGLLTKLKAQQTADQQLLTQLSQ